MYYQIAETNVRIMGSMHMLPAGISEVPAWVTELPGFAGEATLNKRLTGHSLVVRENFPLFIFSMKCSLHAADMSSKSKRSDAVWPDS